MTDIHRQDEVLPLVLEVRPAGSSVERHTLRTIDSAIDLENLEPLAPLNVMGGRSARMGYWWSSTMGAHVTFASSRERTCLLLLDFDPTVTRIVHSPIAACSGSFRVEPPYIVATDAGVAIVVIGWDRSREAEDPTSRKMLKTLCLELGWGIAEFEEPSPVAERTVRWLAGYRHPRNSNPVLEEELLRRFAVPYPLWEGAAPIGPLHRVLPVVYHMLWAGTLSVDIEAGLDQDSMVWSGVR